MVKDFNEYMLDWWHEYLDDHKDECKRLMEEFIGEEETIDNYLEDGQTPYDWCYNDMTDASTIYTTFFGWPSSTCGLYDDMPDKNTFLQEMFAQAAHDYIQTYSFAKEFVEDMADETEGYDDPSGFFSDLQHGGCVSGTVGMLIYNSDCKRIYIEHIDDMEDFKEELEDELGDRIHNKRELPHYTFVCWLCYEELAYRVAGILFPDEF